LHHTLLGIRVVLRADDCDGSQKSNTQVLIYARGYQKPKTQFCYITCVNSLLMEDLVRFLAFFFLLSEIVIFKLIRQNVISILEFPVLYLSCS
jgi:hypothetical protein